MMSDITDEINKAIFEIPVFISGVALKVFRKGAMATKPVLFKLPAPARHENLKDAVKKQISKSTIDNIVEGFYTDEHDFLTREEAMVLVKSFKNGWQLTREYRETTDTKLQSIYLW
jgi:hypothetical protein